MSCRFIKIFAFILVLCAFSCSREPVTLSIVSSPVLENAFPRLETLLQGESRAVRWDVSYKNAENIEEIFSTGLIPDVIILDDKDKMTELLKKGHCDSDTLTPLVSAKLAVAHPDDVALAINGLENLYSYNIAWIGAPDPKTSTTGRYAIKALGEYGIWSYLKDRTLFFPTEKLTAEQFEKEKGIDVAILSLPVAGSASGLKVAMTFPKGSPFSALSIAAAAPINAKNKKEAREFLAGISSEKALKLFYKEGFSQRK